MMVVSIFWFSPPPPFFQSFFRKLRAESQGQHHKSPEKEQVHRATRHKVWSFLVSSPDWGKLLKIKLCCKTINRNVTVIITANYLLHFNFKIRVHFTDTTVWNVFKMSFDFVFAKVWQLYLLVGVQTFIVCLNYVHVH